MIAIDQCDYLLVGTDDGEDDIEQGSVGRQDGQNAGRKLSAKTIKAILELICDEAVSCLNSEHVY